MTYDYGINIDLGDVVLSPNLKIKLESSGNPTKYKLIERVTGQTDNDLFNLVSWKTLTTQQLSDGYITYTLTRPDLYGATVIGIILSDAKGRVSNKTLYWFYYGYANNEPVSYTILGISDANSSITPSTLSGVAGATIQFTVGVTNANYVLDGVYYMSLSDYTSLTYNTADKLTVTSGTVTTTVDSSKYCVYVRTIEDPTVKSLVLDSVSTSVSEVALGASFNVTVLTTYTTDNRVPTAIRLSTDNFATYTDITSYTTNSSTVNTIYTTDVYQTSYSISSAGTFTLSAKILSGVYESNAWTTSITVTTVATSCAIVLGIIGTTNTNTVTNGINRCVTLNSYGLFISLTATFNLTSSSGSSFGTLSSLGTDGTSLNSTCTLNGGAAPASLGSYLSTDYTTAICYNNGWSPKLAGVSFTSIPNGTYTVRVYSSSIATDTFVSNTSKIVTAAGTYNITNSTVGSHNSNTTWFEFGNVVVTNGSVAVHIWVSTSNHTSVPINIIEFTLA